MNLTGVLPFVILLIILKPGFGYLYHNAQCSPDKGAELCDYDDGLTCQDYNGQFVCRCADEMQMKYYLRNDYCVVFINANMTWHIGGHKVVLNCQHRFRHDPDAPPKLCGCNEWHLPELDTIDRDNRCLPTHGQKCDSNLPCHPKSESTCVGGSCQCHHPLRQTPVAMDKNLIKCLSIPEIPQGCMKDAPEESAECILNAVCGDDGECHCKPGFTLETHQSTVTCSVSHQGNCSLSEESNKCNDNAGLVCVEGKCACLHGPDVIFEEVPQECVAIEGSPCTLQEVEFKGRKISCQGGLECMKRVPGGLMGLGVCVKI